MIQLKQNTQTWVWVRLISTAGQAMPGVLYTSVNVHVWKANNTIALVTVGIGDWTELDTGAFIDSGMYALRLPASALDVPGPFMYCVKVSGAETYVGAMQEVSLEISDIPALIEPYVSFTGSGETIKPVIFSVVAPRKNQLRVAFSEPVEMTNAANGALNLLNYSVPGLTILGAVAEGASTVVLTTTVQVTGATYNLTVQNVEDLNGNAIA